MPDQVDTYTNRILVDAQQALTELELLRRNIELYKKEIQTVQQSTQESIKNIAEAIKRTPSFQLSGDTQALSKAVQELGISAGKTSGAFGQLGTVGQFVFGTVLGITAIGILRNIIGWFQQATQAGLEFVKAVYQMEIGVRALQRSGVDITIQQVYENIDKLRDKFKIFTTKELVVGSAAFLNLIRDLEFTRDQIFELQDAIATLAVVNGRAMDEVQRTVALALSSGYTEGLQRLGVSINRVTIAEKAAELGWEKGYTALTEQQRAYATYLLVLEKTAKYADDLAEYYKTLPGQIDQTTTAIEEQKNAIGVLLTPLELLTKKLGAFLLKWLALASPIIMFARVLGMVIRSFELLKDGLLVTFPELETLSEKFEFIVNLSNTISRTIQKVKQSFVDAIDRIAERSERMAKVIDLLKQYYSDLLDIAQGKPLKSLGDFTGESEAQTEEEKIKAIVSELNEIIEEESDEAAEKSRDLWTDFWRDLEKIDRDGVRKREEAFRDLTRKLAEIDLDEARDRDKAYRDFQSDLAEIDRDAANRKAEAERKYRNNEIDEEAKFQEKMRKMREDFLLDLEDAVRERDARQIIRLIRTYNKERDQAIRQNNLDKKERARDYAEELADIERQRQIKRQERAIDLQERLQDIQISAEQERQEAQLKYQQELEDLKRSLDEQKYERAIRLQDDLADLHQHTQDRINELAEGLLQEYNVTAEMLAAIGEVYAQYFGPGGYIEGVLSYYHSLLGNTGVPDLPKWSPKTFDKDTKTPDDGTGFAEGGSFIATRPTYALFGEKGDEFVDAVPLTRPGANVGKMFGNVPAGLGMGGKSQHEVLLLLDPNLSAKIVRQTMNATADVIFKIQRAKK